jgi:glutamate-1-semialdehyde 2,1-aminomutase
MTPTVTASWIERAKRVTPGGVHSPVRAFKAMGATPLAIVEARGPHVFDSNGQRYIDWIGAWGPALLGHANADIERALAEALPHGVLFGLASPKEIELAERVTARVPGCEMVRFVVSGTEATMSAVRVARAATNRPVIIKFAGAYHGHADMFLVAAGSGAATLGVPDSPGVTAGAAADTLIARFNDRDDVERCFQRSLMNAKDRVAAVIVEPVVGNMGCIPPEPGFLQFLREICTANGALLIFDEVMTGFRVSKGGAAERYGITPDLITLGKIVGGGLPLAAFGGKRSLMEMVAPEGPVYQAGTFAAHPLAITAGLAMLDAIDAQPDLYTILEARGAGLQSALVAAANAVNVPVSVQRVASMWTMFVSERPIKSWDDADAVNRERYARFFRAMLARNVLLPPSPFEAAFMSISHDAAVIDETIDAVKGALREAIQ